MQPSTRTIIGVAMMLFGSVLLGVGIHHLIATGTCSSTGYSSHYGPVPFCPSGTAWWILFLIGGIFLGVIGGLVSGGPSALLIVPVVFLGIGVGSLTLGLGNGASHTSKTFATIFGGAFTFFGIVPLLIAGIAALRSTGARTPPSAFSATSLKTDPIMGAYASGASASGGGNPFGTVSAVASPGPFGDANTFGTAAVSSPSASRAAPASAPGSGRGDALDKLEKLAKLRDQGALTEDEFNRQKAKLLTEL